MSLDKEKILRLKTLFGVFFSISAVTLGGGLAMLPMMQREFVEKRHWITDNDMVDTVAVMQSSPGIIASNMAVLIGYRTAGISGAVIAVTGAALPPFIVIIIIAALLHSLTLSEMVNDIFTGVRAAVCALILVSVIKLGKQILKGTFSRILAALGFTALVFFNMDAILLIIAAAVIGLLWNFRQLKGTK